jgi:hypothetical protein
MFFFNLKLYHGEIKKQLSPIYKNIVFEKVFRHFCPKKFIKLKTKEGETCFLDG